MGLQPDLSLHLPAQMTCSPWGMIFSAVPPWDRDTWGSVLSSAAWKMQRELQAFPAGKTTPVVADDDVIEKGIIIFDDIRVYGAAGHLVFLPHFHLFWCVDRYA